MLTKFFLHYDNIQYELTDEDLYNWDEIRCSYKRNSFDGVVRSFTSQFVFINQAKDILMALYLRDRYNAKAIISIHTFTDRWTWEERFSCPLDFSTVSWEKYLLRINAVDNSLAAIIKANKSTKYEFGVGSEITKDALFKFDRIPIMENITYGFTQGDSSSNNSDINVSFYKNKNPWLGNKGSEIFINGIVDWKEDQSDEDGSYLFQVKKDVNITLSYKFEWRADKGDNSIRFGIFILRAGELIPVKGDFGYMETIQSQTWNKIVVSNPDSLPYYTDIDVNIRNKTIGIVSGQVWELVYKGGRYEWEPTYISSEEYFIKKASDNDILLQLQALDIVVARHIADGVADPQQIQFINSEIVFNWIVRGESETIDVFKPKKIATHLLRRMAGDTMKVDVSISTFDHRLANTYLLAAESLRGISGAKMYSSFNDFCDWMSTVFGYIYYVGKPQPSKYKQIRECGQIVGSPWAYTDERYEGEVETDNIFYLPQHAKFLYYAEEDGVFYSEWEGCEDYIDTLTGHPRTDTLFRIAQWSKTKLYYFEPYTSGSLYPILYDHSEDYIGDDGHTVYFVHRSELLNPNSAVKRITNCKEVKYNIDTSVIYSAVTIGYDKKDYDNINGREEFNFNSTYSTGCTATDKTLSMISKYRSDCYGMEFAIQKRGSETTDNSSDNDVFFVLCSRENGELVPDRSIPVTNSTTTQVFNGAFSPAACVRANAGFIGMQTEEMKLMFTSSTGNSDIEIGGESMSADITINSPLATPGNIEFTTDEIDEIADVNELIEVVDEEGILYRGFLKDVDIKYAKNEAVKYKLIIKDIEL